MSERLSTVSSRPEQEIERETPRETAFIEFLAGHPELLDIEPHSTERPFVDAISTPFIYGEESSRHSTDRSTYTTQLWSRDMYREIDIKDNTKQDED